MSLNNVIPAEMLLGTVQIVHKKQENPVVDIPEHLVTDCCISYTIGDIGTTSHTDHPAFAELRKALAARGYIRIPDYPCWNGDKVVARFIFNGFQLEPEDTFYCAGAWAVRIKIRNEKK